MARKESTVCDSCGMIFRSSRDNPRMRGEVYWEISVRKMVCDGGYYQEDSKEIDLCFKCSGDIPEKLKKMLSSLTDKKNTEMAKIANAFRANQEENDR